MVIDTSPMNPMDFRFGKEKQKSTMQCLINNCKVKVFNLFYHILKYQHVSLSLEVIVILFRLFQGLHFVFDESLSDVQQPYIAFNVLHSFLSFFHVVPFLKHNSNLYLLTFYGSILVGVVIILLLVYIVFLGDSDTNVLHTTTAVDVSTSSKTVELFLQILSTLMDYTTRMFVIPFLSLFLSIYSCDNDGTHSYINDVQCWNSQHVIHVIVGSVFVVLFVLFAFVYNALYFETSCAASGATAQCNPIAASTAKTNVSLLIEQTLLCVYFQFKPSNTNNWITVVLLLVTSIYSLSLYMNELPHYNRTIRLFQLSLRIIMFYSSLCLFITKVMQTLITFTSGVYLFLFSLPLILIALCIYPIERSALTFRNISTLNTPRDYLDKINALFFQIDNFSSREAQLALRGYAVHAERTCTMKNCALSKYIKAMNTPNEAIMHFYSHIELIYQAGISRNPFSVKLRISYLLFLIQRVSKHYLALHQIAICISIERSSLEEQFILFRYQKLYDEYGDFRVGISSIAKTVAHTDVEDGMLYKKYSALFKSMITKTLCSYIDFWNLLYEENTEHSHDLSALHRLGTKINHEVNIVHKLYTTITEMNQRDDIEIMKLYYEFVNEILLDTDKANAIKHKIHEKEKMNASCNKKDIEMFDSFNIYQLNKSDHYHYIVLDTKDASFSNIVNLSIGLCPIFGFTKNELLGKTLDMVLPGFLRNGHRNVLKGRLEQYLKDETNEPSSTTSAAALAAAKKLQFNERTVFAVNKAKYLVPLYASICFYRNDKGELFWLVKVAREDNVKDIDYSYNICGNKDKQYCSSMQSLSFGSSKNNPCYVMTNNKFIIQHFSANCVKYLGLNSDVINNTTDISVFIKEFSEEFLKCAIEKENNNNNNNSNNKEERTCIKKKIICSRFNMPTVITWKYMDDLNTMITSAQHNDNNSMNIVDSMMYNNGMMKHNSGKIMMSKHKRATFMMSVVELVFTAQYIEGYIFKFIPCATTTTTNKSVKSSSELCSKNNNNNNKVQHVQTLRKQSRNSMCNNEQALITSTHSIIQVNNYNCMNGNNNEESSFTFIPQNQINNNNIKAFDIDKTYMPSIDNGKVFCFEPETLVFKMSQSQHDTDAITAHNNNTNEYLRTQALKKIQLASHFNTRSNTNDSDVRSHSHSHSNNNSSNSYSSCSYDDVSNNDDDIQSGDSSVNTRHYNNNHNKHSKNTHKRGDGSLSSTTSDINDSNDDNNKNTFVLYSGVTAFNQGKHSVSSPTQSDTYYQVNFSKIKFSIYNFAKGHFEDVEYEKKSAVEKVKDASNANKQDHISSSSSLTMNNKSHSSLTSSQHGAYCASSSMHNELPQTQKLKLKSIIHQIKTSLKKEDTQPTIIRIAIISIIIFILMVGGALLNLLMARASITSVRRRFYHMKSALYLQRNSIVAINNIRELALLNFPEYNFDDFQLSKTSLTSAIIDKLKDVHEILRENVEDILHNIDDVHDDNSRHFIMNTKVNVYVLEEDFNVYEYNLTLINAVYKTIGAIFQIIETNGTAFYPLNLDGYYAFHNTLNGLLNVSNALIDIYNKEISNVVDEQNKAISILFAVNAVITMCSYWFIKNAYANVIKVKESYLKVFFEIGNNVIMFSLCRCESLVKTIQNEENEKSEFFDDNSGQDSAFSALHGELLLTHANVETKVNKTQTAMNNSKSEQTGGSHVYRKVSKEEKAVQSVILLFLFSAVVVATIVYVLFYVLCDMIKGYYLIYNYENELQVHILVFHIVTKEYIFERNSRIYDTEMTTYTETLIKEFQMDYKRKSDQLLKYHKHFPTKFKQRKITLDEEDLCVHLEDFFAERKNIQQQQGNNNNNIHFITKCDEVLYGTPQYGLSVVISAIANSLREVIREVQHGDVVRDELNLKYNLSLYGTDEYYTNTEDYAQRKELYDKHSLMNYLTGKQMKHIQFVSKHLMFILFEETLFILQNSITEELNEQEQSIVIGYSVYIVIIVFVFLCVWRKYVSALSKVIYKTKNMLSIIPKEVLSTLSSIHRLLNINTNITIDDTTTVITSSTTFEEDSSMLEDNSNN